MERALAVSVSSATSLIANDLLITNSASELISFFAGICGDADIIVGVDILEVEVTPVSRRFSSVNAMIIVHWAGRLVFGVSLCDLCTPLSS